jgi:shikimate kinase
MSGTGKSALIHELAARGYKAIDTDSDEWSEWATAIDNGPDCAMGRPDWVWREDQSRRLLAVEDADVIFVSGCKSNQGQFSAQFDQVVLRSAPAAVLVERLTTRTNNPYGKRPEELAQVLRDLRAVEPLLRRRATLEVDTSAPLDQVVETILSLVRG